MTSISAPRTVLPLLLAAALLGGSMSHRAEAAPADGSPPAPGQDIATQLLTAEVQMRNGEYAGALDSYRRILARIEDDGGPWDQRKVEAMLGLGDVFSQLDRHREALGRYNEALYINRMNRGLHDTSQIPALERITRAQVASGEFESANDTQEYAYYVRRRAAGEDPVALLPALYDLAYWYRRVGNIFGARNLYEQAIATLEQAYGERDIRLIKPLQGLAQTYRLERFPVADLARRQAGSTEIGTPRTFDPEGNIVQTTSLGQYSSGEEALQRTIEIYAEHPEIPVRERAEATLSLADWHLVFDKWSSAVDLYAQAQQMLIAEGLSETEVAAMFDEPEPLVFTMPRGPDRPRSSEPMQELRGFVDLQYRVSQRGRVERIEVVGSQPEGMLDFRTRKAIRAARYRPRFEGMEPVDTDDVRYRHTFIYYAPAEPS